MRLNKLANSWTAEPPFVQAHSPKLRHLIQGEGRHSPSRMTRYRSRSHSRYILRVKQTDQLPVEINFVTAIGHFFETEQLSHKGSPHKTLTALPFDLTAIAHTRRAFQARG